MIFNGWFYSFIIGWIVFLLLVDWRSFKQNVWAGIYCSILELWQDGFGAHFTAYSLQNHGIYLLGTSAFLTFGLAFTMGVIFMQYLPTNLKLQLIHIIVFSVGFVIFEFFLVEFGLLIHIHWNYAASIFMNIIIMGSLAWLKQLVYKVRV